MVPNFFRVWSHLYVRLKRFEEVYREESFENKARKVHLICFGVVTCDYPLFSSLGIIFLQIKSIL